MAGCDYGDLERMVVVLKEIEATLHEVRDLLIEINANTPAD